MTSVARIQPEEPAKKIKQSAFQLSEHAYGRRSVTLPVGWTLTDILAPESWSEVAHQLVGNRLNGIPPQEGTMIEVRTQDHAFYAELYVRAVEKMALHVEVIQYKPLGPQESKDTGKFDVRWNVGRRGFDVIRKSDKQIVAEGLPKKEDAYAWIEQTAG